MSDPAISLHAVWAAYGTTPVLGPLSGQFARGSLTAVIGPNGAGKSTLLKLIAALLLPAGGRIDRHGLLPRDIALLSQTAEIDRSFPMTVMDTVLMGDWRHSGAFRRVSTEGRARGLAAIDSVGLAGAEKNLVGTLSAGQFQRVLFARAIMQDAAIILLDEPFSAIDTGTRADLTRLIAERWQAEGRTVIAVLHDIDEVRRVFPQTLLLAGTLVAWGPTADVLSPVHLTAARLMANAA